MLFDLCSLICDFFLSLTTAISCAQESAQHQLFLADSTMKGNEERWTETLAAAHAAHDTAVARLRDQFEAERSRLQADVAQLRSKLASAEDAHAQDKARTCLMFD